MRKALGTAVFSGMLGVTVFGIFFTPVFYAVLERLRDRGVQPVPELLPDDEAAKSKLAVHPG
jgi:multidrug efflux pump